MKKLQIALLLFASSVFTQQPTHELFPSDYKASPCAPENASESFDDISFSSAAFKFLLRTLDVKWIEEHHDEMLALMQPYCAKRATCLATPGNVWWFCNDVFSQEIRVACDKKYSQKTQPHDSESCHTWVDTFMIGVDQHGKQN